MRDVRELIFVTCDLDDLDRELLGPETPLFGEDSPLDLDSVDSLEIIVALQKQYGEDVRVGDRNEAMVVFQNLGTLTDFVRQRRTEAASATV
jgi:acyl carrier protein